MTKTNQVWILNSNNGIVVLQEQSDGTILEKYFTIKNSDGDLLSLAYCMVEDNNGNIWIGTNKGPIVYSSSNQIFDNNDITGNQVKIARKDGTNSADYLLDYEVINDIAVDGGNQQRRHDRTERQTTKVGSSDAAHLLLAKAQKPHPGCAEYRNTDHHRVTHQCHNQCGGNGSPTIKYVRAVSAITGIIQDGST